MKNSLGKITRSLLALSGLGLIVVLFVPLWTIDLVAPQYPEGLVLIIYPHGLGGNVDIINGLNHYIGMKTLHTEDFIEFQILPYIIGIFAALFLLVAAVGKRKLLYILTALYMLFGIVSMVDFYKWEYDYGHNLDPNAAIKVPGMAYQPPLIGYKQLLNFSAYSIPATGGWIFLGAGVLVLGLTIVESRKAKRWEQTHAPMKSIVAALVLISLSSCSTEPQQINFGTDNCYFCKMTITDRQFGAELVTRKGKVYKFDDTHCITTFIKAGEVKKDQIAGTYLVDFTTSKLIAADKSFLLSSEQLKSPMGGNVAAFASREDLNKTNSKYSGTVMSWNELIK
jgi:copper chaperone NosL